MSAPLEVQAEKRMNRYQNREVFLTALFDGLPGLIEVRSFSLRGTPRVTFARLIEEALDAVERDCVDGFNVYVGVATRGDKRKDDGKISGGKDNLVAVRGWFIDRDGLTEEGAREEYEITLEGFPLPPSMRVDSGGGEHDYWFAEDYIDLTTPDQIRVFENTLKGLADALGGDPAATDASRILRVAGTFNIPGSDKIAKGRVKTPCRIISQRDALYSPDDLDVFRVRGASLKPQPTTSTAQPGAVLFQHPHRHEALKRHAAFLRKSGLSLEAAQAALLVFNRERCDPPKPEDEVQSLAQWAVQVQPGERSTQEVEAGENARFEELAQLSPTEYDRCRQEVAAELRIRVSTLDAEVCKRRPTEERREGQGSEATALFKDPDPWPDPVDGAELLKELASAYSRFLVLPTGAATALALWTVHTHAHDAASISPILAIVSPEKRCGKTTLLAVLQHVVRRPLPASNITAAALFRTTEKWCPTVLVDEADSFLRDSDELRGILNSGHNRRQAVAIRTAGDEHEPRIFSTWAPKAIALIGSLPPTLEDRSVTISMRRRGPGEKVERLRGDQDNGLGNLGRRCTRWVADHMEGLRMADPEVSEALHDRARDNWRALLAIADEAGGEWPENARSAAKELTSSEEETSRGVLLLADVRDVFEQAKNPERMASEDLCRLLVALSDRPWAEITRGGKPLSTNSLARRLKPFGVRPKKIRFGENTAHGYELEHFADPFSRYLPPPQDPGIPTGTPEQRNGNGGYSRAQLEHRAGRFRLENPKTSMKSRDVPVFQLGNRISRTRSHLSPTWRSSREHRGALGRPSVAGCPSSPA